MTRAVDTGGAGLEGAWILNDLSCAVFFLRVIVCAASQQFMFICIFSVM